MRIDGKCHCGEIRYRAEIDPEQVSICHCADCQALTGTAFRVTIEAARADIEIEGEPRVYVKRAESGRPRLQYFCPTCGSALFTSGDADDRWGIRWGTVAQRAALVPRRQVWHRSAAPFLAGIADLPASEGE